MESINKLDFNHLYMGRTSPDGIDRINEFLENNIWAIGWSNLGDLTAQYMGDIRSMLELNHYTPSNVTVGMINHFVNRIKIDDVLLMVHGEDIYVAVIKSDYYYDKSKVQDGYCHQRQVMFLNKNNPIKRSYLPEELKKSLAIQNTVANLDHRINDFKVFLKEKKTDRIPFNKNCLKQQIKELIPQAIQNIRKDLGSDDINRRLDASIEVLKLYEDLNK